MLVTDQAKLIRTTVGDIRIAGRNTQGVTIFRVADEEHVVSAARIEEGEEEAEAVVDVETPTLASDEATIGGGDDGGDGGQDG
jgi:DNA gyrase subunit A